MGEQSLAQGAGCLSQIQFDRLRARLEAGPEQRQLVGVVIVQGAGGYLRPLRNPPHGCPAKSRLHELLLGRLQNRLTLQGRLCGTGAAGAACFPWHE